ESNEGKLTYLEKVLEFDPDNETAKAGYETARNSIRTNLLAEARSAAVAGNAAEAEELLDAIIAEEPNAEDAWVLRSHLANGFDAKIVAFRRVLEINPDNAGAKAGLDSLTSIMDAVAASEPAPEKVVEEIVETAPAEVELASSEESFAGEAAEEMASSEASSVGSSPFDSFADESADDFDAALSEALTALTAVVDTDSETEFESAEAFAQPAAETEEHAAFSPEPEVAASESTTTLSLAEQEAPQEQEEITHELITEEAPVSEGVHEEEHSNHEVQASAPETADAPQTEALEDVPAISAPFSNPFETEGFRQEKDEFATVVSVDLDPVSLAAVQNYDFKTLHPVTESNGDNGFNVPFDATMYGGGIPMPVGDFDQASPFENTGFETRVFVDQAGGDAKTVSATAACSFCSADNDIQAIACQGCLSVLTLADLELILANHHADKVVLRQAVERMESEKATREFTEAELTTLGIGHLNLRNLQYGFNYLQEASQKNPNNVVLSGQVNALLIRLDEIRQQDEAHESMSKGKTILVVDDSPTVRKLIAGKLEKCGHQVVCSSDGVEAMVQLESMRPDLVLLDITMPRMDGYQVCKLIRGNVATKDVPVVMISGKDGFFDKVRGRMAGTSGYITKPFGPETLMKAVENYLKAEHVAEV
ncbi:MAG: response regulator, partial [Acidobacteria bacterium]|nr:response regulator [Acidobacteriota bacterium]